MKNKYTFSVFTPTYNRKELLADLYEDLKKQSYLDFEWLIVDDGSEDGTFAEVKQWITEGIIDINYFYKENGGKHTAINMGISKAKGELFFLADSDDRLVPNGLDMILKAWKSINNKKAFCGVTALFQYENGDPVGTTFRHIPEDVSFVDLYHKYGVKGDKVVCFLTEVLKKYPFPESKGIRFVMEAVVWDEIAKKYKIKCINEVIQIKKYMEDGLTRNTYNPRMIKGLAFSFLMLINNNTYSYKKLPNLWIWNYIYLSSNSLLAGVSYFKHLRSLLDKIMYVLLFPRGYFAYLRMKKYMPRLGGDYVKKI